MKKYSIILILFVLFLLLAVAIFTLVIPENSDVIKVGYLPTDHSAALLVAKHNKLYEKNGLNVQTVQISAGSNIVDAVASGDLDIGYVGITPTMQGISKGVPIKVVGAVNLEGSGIVVQPNSTITSPADLIGKNIASPGVSSIQQVLLQYELEKYNITLKDVNIISMNVFNIPSSLAARKVDAYISYEPFVSMAPYQNIGEVLIYSEDIIKDHPCCVIITREEYIENHPEKLDKFLEIHDNTTKYVNNHPNETANILNQELTTNLDVEHLSLQHIMFVSRIDKSFQDKVLELVKIENQMGYLNKSLTSDDIFNTEFLG
ncbi:MAG TPA: ABC transporter substrate-binding protein [Methanobacterium sp.]|jgi:NitT/TauT family transport system substrate-binding protein|nr:ABC transporter substrate-binding protein [Methanobacterium sp.]